ncbi:MAG: 4Fe-4S dicluster domain-containing protein, partial [Bacteroidales bacterium]
NTIDLADPSPLFQGNDKEMDRFIESLGAGNTGGVIFYDVNPVYDHPKTNRIQEGLSKCSLVVSIASQLNETTEMCRYVCPDHHYLESWNDMKIRNNAYSLSQPAIRPVFDTRQGQESLLKWTGNPDSWHDYVRDFWEENLYPRSNSQDFYDFWNSSLRDGVFEAKGPAEKSTGRFNANLLAQVSRNYPDSEDAFELCLYEKVSIGSGKHANNPWLQEMPDPVSRATWDNYLCVSPSDAKLNGWQTGDLITIDHKITIPVLIQPGQAKGTVSAALGYGRKKAGKVAEGTGQNLAELITLADGNRIYASKISSIEKTGEGYRLAVTQTHHSMEGRAIIRKTSLKDYLKDPASGNHLHEEIEKKHTTLYEKHEFPGHHWGMGIDLNKCIGCSACLIACSAENNVPVVGKNEVLRAHEMHWIRIDRYYEGDADNPKTLRQPVMCQHCDNAPCENVCPVAATNHSDEGINQMAYNRCIGTRYCNNNCPYKVRRFNWFDYTTADALKNNTVDPAGMTVDLKRMVLNPDVTVRAKGVIEKCSFCMQRIQEKKLTAKLESRRLKDGEIKTACQQACPAEAIVFGDLNDKESKVSKWFADPRNYHLLEELHTLPSVGYLTRVSNREEG